MQPSEDGRRIPISRGLFVVVDDADYAWAMQFRWFAFLGHTGIWYAIRNDRSGSRKRSPRMHREMLGAKPGEIIDHINGNGLDNRRANLRFCTNQQNAANGRRRSQDKPYKGVYRQGERRGWTARIVVDGKQQYLGTFATAEAAADAYDAAAVAAHGIFARTNAAMFNQEAAS
jgi:hypothetical protein